MRAVTVQMEVDYKALIAVLDSKRENIVEFKTVVTTNTAEIKW